LPVPISCGFTLADSIIFWQYIRFKIVYDTLFEATWKRYNNLAKPKKYTNRNDSRFAHLGTAIEFASALALHCSGGGVNKEGQ
jgi:hypothetical protein